MDLRKYAPLPADHPAVTTPERCRWCDRDFIAGDETTLVPMRRVEGNLWEAALLHYDCGQEAVAEAQQ